MIYLSSQLWFPSVTEASKEGLLAIGGDLSSDRLLLAYRSGIFPWFEDDQPILWWSPDPRMVLFPERFKVSKSLKKVLDANIFQVTFNQNFSEVIKQCASVKRKGQRGTWITSEMISAYQELHEKGFAKSVEVWKEGKLVGGLYGIDLPEKKVFCGESMFSKESNASKVGFYILIEKLKERNYKLIDCQVYTNHLYSLGAEEIPRNEFLKALGF
ncbi:leucyl/phenylalanyl-tRNA--protein transferase [Aureisphaera sp. CAU 1614]|uniref:Leucyl/phenylalanyl-tRNA--protein transferase n=1 Tax=Halomarinibacterium sedimenti TaxID=2857106 RepID=A0A9X1FLY5_9FLAO|nr:leucyl/phenylalanyl-tRNA--protein transferase [Halomarinibacterium sedimenti]MBW2937015.1 leucyl/phenylalanyl-tRNA--protein transferase [Halomarinibacterium sedimenti]